MPVGTGIYFHGMTDATHPVEAVHPPMKRVRFVTNSEAAPGMTLAFHIQSVHSSQLFKLAAGIVLTAELIEQLRRRHVNCFAIEIDETRSIEEIASHLIASQEQIKALFSLLEPADSVVSTLYSSMMEYRLCFS